MLTLLTISSFGAGLASSEFIDETHHWGDKQIDVHTWDLPALKARYLLDHLPTVGRVLEVGCGSGRILNTIAAYRPHLELYGCDIRPLQYAPTNFTFSLVASDDTSLPYDTETFGAILLVDVLEHFEDPVAALHAASGVLANRGSVISFTPLEGQPLSPYRFYRFLLGQDLYARTKEHIHAYSERSLRLLLDAEYELQDTNYAYHWFGHVMDATFFALLASPRLRKRYWGQNPYYEEIGTGAGSSNTHSAFGSLLRVANAVAYLESRALRRVSLGSAGLLFVASPRSAMSLSDIA